MTALCPGSLRASGPCIHGEFDVHPWPIREIDGFPEGCSCESSLIWLRYIGHSRLCSLYRSYLVVDKHVGLDRLTASEASDLFMADPDDEC